MGLICLPPDDAGKAADGADGSGGAGAGAADGSGGTRGAAGDSHQSHANGPTHERPGQQPRSAFDVLDEQVDAINVMTLRKVISSAQAKVLQQGVRLKLDVQRQRMAAPATEPISDDVLEACRRDPSLINVLRPFLNDEQLRQFFAEDANAPDVHE